MNQKAILWAAPLALDLSDQSAQLDGRPIELGPKVFALLRALMEAPQRVVTKEELFDSVWDGRFVSEAVLTTTMKELRKALGDDAREPAFIATVHGRGYRFLKPVEVKTPEAAPDEALPAAQMHAGGNQPDARPPKRPVVQISAALVAVLLVAIVAIAAPLLGKGTPAAAAATEVASLAVLPFEDLSAGKDQRYLADGMAEEILNVLMAVDGLKTASRTSSFAYRGRGDITAQQIGRELGVGHVLEGSVRTDKSTVRVRVRLVDARTGQTAWSRDYQRDFSVENVFRIEDEVSERVVSQLRTSLDAGLGVHDARSRTAAAGTTSLRAYSLYLRAQEYFLERRDEDQGIAMMREATKVDPGFARAWELLGALLFVGGNATVTDEGRMAIDRALALDPRLSLAHAVKGVMIDYTQPADWDAGIGSLEKALELDPENTTGLLWLGNELHKLGYLERSQQLLERCLKLDPAYDRCRLHLSWVLQMRGQTDRGLEEHRRLLRDGGQPTDTMFLQELVLRGDDEQVRETLARLPNRTPMPPVILAALKSRPKDMKPVHQALRTWAMDMDSRYPVYPLALELGAYELYSPILAPNFALWLPGTPEFRKSPDFKWVIRSMNIESYWRKHGFPDQCWPKGTDDFECS